MKSILLMFVIPLVAAFVPAILFPARGAFSTQHFANWDSNSGNNYNDIGQGGMDPNMIDPQQGSAGVQKDRNFLEDVIKKLLGRKDPPKDDVKEKKTAFKPKSRKKNKISESTDTVRVPLFLHADTDYEQETVVRKLVDIVPELNRLTVEQMYQDAMRDGNVTLGHFPVEKALEYHAVLRDADPMILTTVDYSPPELSADELCSHLGKKRLDEIKMRWGFLNRTDEELERLGDLDQREQRIFKKNFMQDDEYMDFIGRPEEDPRWDDHDPIIDEILQMEV